jgi:hypothetical protein
LAIEFKIIYCYYFTSFFVMEYLSQSFYLNHFFISTSFLFFVLRIALIIKSIAGALSVQASCPSCKIYIFLVGVEFIRPEKGLMNQTPTFCLLIFFCLLPSSHDTRYAIHDTNKAPDFFFTRYDSRNTRY